MIHDYSSEYKSNERKIAASLLVGIVGTVVCVMGGGFGGLYLGHQATEYLSRTLELSKYVEGGLNFVIPACTGVVVGLAGSRISRSLSRQFDKLMGLDKLL